MSNFVSNLSKRKKKKDIDMTRQGDNLRREYEQIKFQEKSRFDILNAAHKQDSSRKLSENSFTGVDKRSEEFLVQLKHSMRKLMIFAKTDPTLLKTVIEIIHEDERRDREENERAKVDDIEILGRPRQWKTKTWEVFKETVSNRIALIPKEAGGNRSADWLSLHLELLRQAVTDDLQHIKKYVVPLFPEDWDVYKDSVSCYHECITKHLEEIVAGGLEQLEMTQLLVWLNEYTGSALLKNPALSIRDSELLGKPLSYQTLSTLRERYLNEVGRNLKDWLGKTLKADMTDWSSQNEPRRDGDKYYYTTYPVHTFQMINENIEQATRISDDIKNQLLDTSLKELQTNLEQYTTAVKDYINKWSSKSRNSRDIRASFRISTKKSPEQIKNPCLIQHSIAILNNFCLIDRNLDQLKDTFTVSDIDHEKQLANLKNMIQEQSTESFELFKSNLQAEMKPHEDRLLTNQWLDTPSTHEDGPVETICQLTRDYTSGLRVQFFRSGTWDIGRFARQEYLRAMMEKRLVCKSEDERKAVARKICTEVDKLKETFNSLSSADIEKANSEWEVVKKMADIVQVEKTTVKLQVTCLVNLYADVDRKHLSRILRIRGDFSNVLRKKRFITDALKKPKHISEDEKIATKETIFSAVKIK